MDRHLRLGWGVCAALALVMVAGCKPSPARKVVGTWVVDEQQGMMGLLAKSGMSIKFSADGILTISGGVPGAKVAQNGSWRFVETKEDSLVLETRLEGHPAVKMKVTVIDGDTIRLAPPSLPGALEVTFKRAA